MRNTQFPVLPKYSLSVSGANNLFGLWGNGEKRKCTAVRLSHLRFISYYKTAGQNETISNLLSFHTLTLKTDYSWCQGFQQPPH